VTFFPAVFFAWATGVFGAVCVLACWIGQRIARAVRALIERHRHRRDLRRWHETCAIHDHALREAADRVLRDAAQAERRQR
jgi:hypothetical protein